MLRVYLRAAGCADELVDDVWQETMIVAWRKLDQYDRTRPFGAWLRGIAAKILLAHRRNARRMVLIGDEETLEYLSDQLHRYQQLPGDTLDDKLAALRECVSHLPAHERNCIELRFQKDLMPASISEATGDALETVKKRLQRAKSRLLECIEKKLRILPV